MLLLLSLLTPTIFFADIIRDLEIDSVFSKINLTKTCYGSKTLQSLLENPTNNAKTLKKRQAIIAYIAENETIHHKISSLLTHFGEQEKHFQSMFQPSTDIETTMFENFYFSHDAFKNWNYSPAHLELGQVAYFGNLCSSLVQHSLSFAIFTWGLEEEHVCSVHPPKKHAHGHKHDKKKDKKHSHDDKPKHTDSSSCAYNHDHSQCTHDTEHSISKDTHHHHHAAPSSNHAHNHSHCTHDTEHSITKDTHHNHECNHHHHAAPSSNNIFQTLFKSSAFRSAFQAWHTIAQIQELYAIQSVVRNHLKCITELQSQLIGIAHGMRTLRQIHALIKNHPEISDHITHYQELENVCLSLNVSDKLTTLLELLKTKTFTDNASVFSRIGNILAAHKIAQEVAHELEPALAAIGELDAYANCANLISQTQECFLRYSFATYITEKTPQLIAHNIWHPLASGKNIQCNSIRLGVENGPRNIIITGPNASGKSTNLKAIMLCAYLAQTLTIVPAQEYGHTIYKDIYSSMIVTDNITENMSLFVAELNNAEQLLNHVEILKDHEFMIVALDELFKSTHHEKGQAVARKLLEHLYASPQVITIVSTHFEELVTLADIADHKCRNYTLDNFKLVPGIGSCDNAFVIVKDTTKSKLLD
jgi:hypothetical protein